MPEPRQISVFAYEEDGELFLHRCPVCGEPGEKGSVCEHDPPIADAYKGADRPERKPVRVPGVGEEPRYTLEEFGDLLLGDESVDAAAEAAHEALRPFLGGVSVWSKLWEGARKRRIGAAQASLEAALDHFTQQPAGVGAGLTLRPSRETRGVRENPLVSADSDGNQAVSQFCGTAHHVLCPGCPCSCHSDGNQQPQGGGQ